VIYHFPIDSLHLSPNFLVQILIGVLHLTCALLVLNFRSGIQHHGY